MTDTTSDTSTKSRGRLVPLLVAVSCVVILHFAALLVVFTGASGWDNACDILFDESGPEGEAWSAWALKDQTYWVDPGYTCEYLILYSGETLILRKDLSVARNVVMAITAGGAALATARYVAYRRRHSLAVPA